MPRVVRWRKAADDDLAEIVEHIAKDSPDAAERLLNGILARIAGLAQFPYLGSVCPHYSKTRQLIHGNYIIYYSVSRREIVVRAIVHGARLFRLSWLRRE
jgi:toxin ParE1/3/4